MLKKTAYAILLTTLFSSATHADELPYIDNRSNAAALIESFYNAVSRKEYGRAWSYFGDQKPVATFDAFVKGYESTKEVAVRTGAISQEGAAGSTYYQVPVGILAYEAEGDDKVFGGCYTVRLANPQVQGEAFAPMHIEKAELKPSDKDYDLAVPEKCGDGPAAPFDAAMEAAKRQYAANDATQCGTANPVTNEPAYPTERYEIAYKSKYDSETDPERKAVLMRFYCDAGAYNEAHFYYLYQEDSGVGRLAQLSFAQPNVEPKYEGDSDSKLLALPIVGWSSRLQLTNSGYDPKTKSITEHALWRGMGDASSTGVWVFDEGEFKLERYDVDASYDGEINPQSVYQARK